MPALLRQVILIGLVLASVALRGQAGQVEITYLANEGVLIQCGNQKVLVDALFRDSLDDYARLSSDAQEQLETGKPIFDDVTLALATHFHLDHWDAGAITRFLKNNPQAVFASAPEATAMLPWSQRQQVRALWPDAGKSEEVQRGSIRVSAFRLQHGETQSLGYRISLCGAEVFHLGDAQGSAEDLASVRRLGNATVALVPYWWLLDDKAAEFLRQQWKPGHIVALHFGSTNTGEQKKVQTAWPQAWVTQKQGETRRF